MLKFVIFAFVFVFEFCASRGGISYEFFELFLGL